MNVLGGLSKITFVITQKKYLSHIPKDMIFA